MKKHSKIIQCDSRGQIVIPKEIRNLFGIKAGTAFFIYQVSDDEILLKKVQEPKINKVLTKYINKKKQ